MILRVLLSHVLQRETLMVDLSDSVRVLALHSARWRESSDCYINHEITNELAKKSYKSLFVCFILV